MELIQLNREYEKVSTSVALTAADTHTDVIAAVAGKITYIQKITLSITVHEASAVVSVESHSTASGAVRLIAKHTDLAAAAMVPSVVVWDFAPNGTPLDENGHLAVVVATATTFTAVLTVEGYRRLPPEGSVAATLTTALTGLNNDIVFTAAIVGEGGNAYIMTYADSGIDQVFAIVVTNTGIVITLATSHTDVITTTANDIVAAINVNASARVLMSAALAAGNDGTGLVTALTATHLSGGRLPQ
jgi:hypothetical protein